jgi:hypothetical protein
MSNTQTPILDIYQLRRERAMEFLGTRWLLARPINRSLKS